MNLWEEVDHKNSIRGTAFTVKAIRNINHVLEASDVEGISAEGIFEFLLTTMDIVSFKDYLKRYIYRRAGMEDTFAEVGDEVYKSIIMDTWKRNRAPYSFKPTTVPWSRIVSRWLTQDSVQRSTIFLIGFGLKMTSTDVSEFLKKVLKESDFDLNDPTELVYWYCFQHGLPYAKALDLLQHEPVYENKIITPDQLRMERNDDDFLVCLTACREKANSEHREEERYKVFQTLYRDCKQAIADLYDTEKHPDEIGASDIEKTLYDDGIPITIGGNRQKMSKSKLNQCFNHKRVTRQRLDSLIKGKQEVTRYDLITLQFLISSQMEDEEPELRCQYFLEDVNYLLEKCGMMKLYPANPYEAFMVICLMTEDPLFTFYDVWKLSYDEK